MSDKLTVPEKSCPVHGVPMHRCGLVYYCERCKIPSPSVDDLQRSALRDYDTPTNLVAYGAWIRRAIHAEHERDKLRQLNESLTVRVATGTRGGGVSHDLDLSTPRSSRDDNSRHA